MSIVDLFRINWKAERSFMSDGLVGLRKVGAPSTVVTKGLVKPPLSNSWAEILRTGVPEPEVVVELARFEATAEAPEEAIVEEAADEEA